ncbi:MAG: ABC transporter permease [Janthinobacterium lividum]
MKRPSSFTLGGRTYSPAASLALTAPFLLILLLAFVLPILVLLCESLFVPGPTLANYARIFEQPAYLRILFRTLRIAAEVTLSALLLGYPLAWLMANRHGWRLAFLLAAVLLPLWTSVLVRTYAWLVLLQRDGMVNQILSGLHLIDKPVGLLYTEGTVVMAIAHVLLPFMILPLYASLRAIPAEYSRAAQVLGASDAAAFREIVLPLSLPGAASGCLMVFLLSLGFFVTPALVGGPQQKMLATLVQQQVTELLNWPFAGAIVGTLLVVVLVLVAIFNRLVRLDRFVGQS